MMVENNKLQEIVVTIHAQARLLRHAGKTAEAAGMERRAAELRSLCTPAPQSNLVEFTRRAA